MAITHLTKSSKESSRAAWLDSSAMNLLVDYYTEVQFRSYGSGCTLENTLPWLKELQLGYLCIYAKGHSGYTSWESSLKTKHTMLSQNMPSFFRHMTREAGCKLVLYFSGLLDGIAGDRHPDWRMKNLDGTDKEWFQDFKCFHSYGVCPLSPFFEEWASVQLRELIEEYDPDGFWFDGDWPGPCYCFRCQTHFRQQTGWTEPWSEVIQRPDFNTTYKPIWNKTESLWRERCNGLIKTLKPDCVYSAGNVSPRREFLGPFDWRSGDFFSPGLFQLHDMARMMRWYSTLGVPFDAFVCDTSFTHGRKHVRSRTKTIDRMLQEAATIAANGGTVGYWTYPDGDGKLIPSRMRKAVAVRRFLAERKEVFLGSMPYPETAILATDPASSTFGEASIEGAHKALAALHRSPVVMDESGLNADFTYRLAVVPEQAVITPETVKKLVAFVRRGGLLLTTGNSIQSPGIQRLLGVKSVQAGSVADGHVFLHDGPFGEPTGVDLPWDRLTLDRRRTTSSDTTELYPLYLSKDSLNPEVRNLPNNWPMHGLVDEENPEPAGFPAAILRKVGKGSVIHIPTGLFAHYRTLGDPQILRWIRELLHQLDPAPFLTTNAPSWVDISLRRKGRELLIHLVNQNPGRDVARLGTDDTWVDEIPSVGPFVISIQQAKSPKSLTWDPGSSLLPINHHNGILHMEVPIFRVHGCIRVV